MSHQKNGAPWTYPEAHRIAARFRSGETLAQVAADVGRSPNAVKKAVARYMGMTYSDIRSQWLRRQRHDVLKEYASGNLGIQAAGEQLGLSPRSVSKYATHHGYEPPKQVHQYSRQCEMRAYVLRDSGQTWKQVATAIGCSRSTAKRLAGRYQVVMQTFSKSA